MKRRVAFVVVSLALSAPSLFAAGPGDSTEKSWYDKTVRKIVHTIQHIVQPLADELLPPRP